MRERTKSLLSPSVKLASSLTAAATALFVSESEWTAEATEGLFAFGEQSEPITQMDSRDRCSERSSNEEKIVS